MRKVIVNEWMSLDGVVQAPGQADEDTDGGFRHGGWHLRYFDEPSQKWVVGGYAERLPVWAPHLRDPRGLLANRPRGGASRRAASELVAQIRGVENAY
jgi:hypothetical protein